MVRAALVSVLALASGCAHLPRSFAHALERRDGHDGRSEIVAAARHATVHAATGATEAAADARVALTLVASGEPAPSVLDRDERTRLRIELASIVAEEHTSTSLYVGGGIVLGHGILLTVLGAALHSDDGPSLSLDFYSPLSDPLVGAGVGLSALGLLLVVIGGALERDADVARERWGHPHLGVEADASGTRLVVSGAF